MTTNAATPDFAAAYNATGTAWKAGPARVYDQLAQTLCDQCPVPLAGAVVLDLGAGTGAASSAARRRGARVVAVDVALGMLAVGGPRPPAVAGDALALPFAPGAFDAVLAAFSLNHLVDPVTGLRQAAGVLRPGGGLLIAAFAAGEGHPAKAATDAAASALGWKPPAWYTALQREAVPQLATVERAAAAAGAASLVGAAVAQVDVAFPGLGPHDLVAWRLGMAHLAPFVRSLSRAERAALVADAAARLGPDSPELVHSVIVLTWRRPPHGRGGRSAEEAGHQLPSGVGVR